jgi:hypothetical protein
MSTGAPGLRHHVAALTMSELGEISRDAVAGPAGRDALGAPAQAVRGYVTAHPGRYAATMGAEFTGPGEPLLTTSTRAIELLAAVLRAATASATNR